MSDAKQSISDARIYKTYFVTKCVPTTGIRFVENYPKPVSDSAFFASICNLQTIKPTVRSALFQQHLGSLDREIQEL